MNKSCLDLRGKGLYIKGHNDCGVTAYVLKIGLRRIILGQQVRTRSRGGVPSKSGTGFRSATFGVGSQQLEFSKEANLVYDRGVEPFDSSQKKGLAQDFSRAKLKHDRGVEQLEARRAHNPKVAGSSPAPATTGSHNFCGCRFFCVPGMGNNLAVKVRYGG